MPTLTYNVRQAPEAYHCRRVPHPPTPAPNPIPPPICCLPHLSLLAMRNVVKAQDMNGTEAGQCFRRGVL